MCPVSTGGRGGGGRLRVVGFGLSFMADLDAALPRTAVPALTRGVSD